MELLIGLGVVVGIVLFVIGLYNRLVALRQNRNNAFSDIDVQLKQRFDLVPSLIETVKGYAAHEKSVFEAVTAARAGVAQSSGTDDRLKAEQRLGGALMGLYAVAENYPALKADQNFQQLMSELSDLENKIAAARRFFNNATSEYNTMVQQFPANLLASSFGFHTEIFYEDTSVDRATLEKAPSVKFSTMQVATKGLQGEIWSNNFKSVVLLALYPVILAAVVFAVITAYGYFSGYAPIDDMGVRSTAAMNYAESILLQYWPIIVSVVSIWFIIAYLFQGSMIRAMSHSHPVTRKEEPQLYNLVENMCIATGTTMPRLEIVETHARNAFASGISDSSFCITVTRGLMQSLSKDELEGVLAHELTHILNRDVRLLIVCVIFTGMLGVAAQLFWSNLRYMLWVPRSSNRKSGGGLALLFVIAAILWVGYMATLLTRFAISRKREFLADAGAVQITKNPDAMMRALLRISGAADIPKAPGDIKAMCFENAALFLGLFATHPPITDRIQAISDYSGAPIPAIPPKLRAESDEVFHRPPETRDNWTTRQRFKSRRTDNPWR